MTKGSSSAGALPIAVRVYPDLKPSQPERKAPQIDGMLVFDCETRTDKTQALTFGSYRFLVAGRCLEEGLFYGDDLTPREKATLERYAASHPADTDPRGIPERGIPSNPELRLLPIAEFRRLLYRVAYKGRGLLCTFNFPFDASRCAIGYVESRDRFLGGFTFQFFQYRDRAGQLRAHPYRPGIAVKHMDSKRALKGFTGAIDPDKLDQIPEGELKPKKGYVFRGHMLDLRTLAFALTDRSLSLEAACELFGVEHGKQKVEKHGIITPEYIDYNRRDVLAIDRARSQAARGIRSPSDPAASDEGVLGGLDRQSLSGSNGRSRLCSHACRIFQSGISDMLNRPSSVGVRARTFAKFRFQ